MDYECGYFACNKNLYFLRTILSSYIGLCINTIGKTGGKYPQGISILITLHGWAHLPRKLKQGASLDLCLIINGNKGGKSPKCIYILITCRNQAQLLQKPKQSDLLVLCLSTNGDKEEKCSKGIYAPHMSWSCPSLMKTKTVFFNHPLLNY